MTLHFWEVTVFAFFKSIFALSGSFGVFVSCQLRR